MARDFFVVQQLDLFPVIFISLVSRKCEHKSGMGVNNTTHSNSRVHSAQLLHLVIVSLHIHSALSPQQPHVHPTQSSFFVGLRSAHFLTSFALTLSLTSFELACIEKTSAAQPTGQKTPVQPTLCCALRHVRLLKLHTFYKTNRANFAFDLGSKMTKYATDHHSTTFAPLPAAAAAAVGILACKAV